MISLKFKSEFKFPKKAAVNKKHVEDGPLANVEASLAAHEFGHLANENYFFPNFDVFPFSWVCITTTPLRRARPGCATTQRAACPATCAGEFK